ncbi:unnamed protein product [Gadus morhua 'NCC']
MDMLALLLVGLTASPWDSTHSLRWSSILTVIVEKRFYRLEINRQTNSICDDWCLHRDGA